MNLFFSIVSLLSAGRGQSLSEGRTFQKRGIAHANTLRRKHVWHVQSRARPVWLERHEQERAVGYEVGHGLNQVSQGGQGKDFQV